jgi:hypothetical protein
MVELDRADAVRKVIEVFDVAVVDGSIELALIKCHNRLAELGELSSGWHDGRGSPIEKMALSTAGSFLKARPSLSPQMKIYPEDNGGVLIELEENGWDISLEFAPDGSIELYGIQTSGDGEFEPIAFQGLDADLLSEFDRRAGR